MKFGVSKCSAGHSAGPVPPSPPSPELSGRGGRAAQGTRERSLPAPAGPARLRSLHGATAAEPGGCVAGEARTLSPAPPGGCRRRLRPALPATPRRAGAGAAAHGSEGAPPPHRDGPGRAGPRLYPCAVEVRGAAASGKQKGSRQRSGGSSAGGRHRLGAGGVGRRRVAKLLPLRRP